MRAALPLLFIAVQLAHAQTDLPPWATHLLDEVRTSSYPELARRDIRLQSFFSQSDYFEARFSLSRFLTGRPMQYIVRVNSRPVLQTCPEEARRAILAHELAHVLYYSRAKRWRLLGLARLLRAKPRTRFEHAADRMAIQRGYANGLKQYRSWLYQNVPSKALPGKLRDYLSPSEIDKEKGGAP